MATDKTEPWKSVTLTGIHLEDFLYHVQGTFASSLENFKQKQASPERQELYKAAQSLLFLPNQKPRESLGFDEMQNILPTSNGRVEDSVFVALRVSMRACFRISAALQDGLTQEIEEIHESGRKDLEKLLPALLETPVPDDVKYTTASDVFARQLLNSEATWKATIAQRAKNPKGPQSLPSDIFSETLIAHIREQLDKALRANANTLGLPNSESVLEQLRAAALDKMRRSLPQNPSSPN